MPFPPNFDHAWDLTQPPDTQLANLLGQDIRNLKDDVMQRMSLLSGTLANRPAPETVNATWGGVGYGLLYFATDTGQIFQWNGGGWVDVTSSFAKSTLLNAQGNLAPIVGTGVGQSFYSYNLQANAVPNLKAIRVTAAWSHSTGTNNINYNLSLNGVIVSGPFGPGVNVVGDSGFVATILNTGAAAGVCYGVYTFVSSFGSSPTTTVVGGLNWAGIQALQINFNVPAPDQITPRQFLVELIS
jgi:hypothetical protein